MLGDCFFYNLIFILNRRKSKKLNFFSETKCVELFYRISEIANHKGPWVFRRIFYAIFLVIYLYRVDKRFLRLDSRKLSPRKDD